MYTDSQLLDAIEYHVSAIRMEGKRVGQHTITACVLEYIIDGETKSCWGYTLRNAVNKMIDEL